ncbi:MAG: ribosome recycling factor [Defluviitaleaceae bacterium]|nr:ribosome recycling factor [Defluviitaleaceae bacterium]MCL2264045.1 ribosome recycling factor [Defluviitaleaceae bacterium]
MDTKNFEERMKKTIAVLEEEFSTIRVGRANPRVLDRLMVNYYGSDVPVSQVGNITVPEARLLQIAPWESNMLKEIEKAIQASDIGINPTNDGKVIRLVFPELTEERRKDLAKDIKKKGEDSKVSIRNIRREAMDAFAKSQKKSEITEDDLKQLEKEIQNLTDKYIAELDKKVEAKNKEIMTV